MIGTEVGTEDCVMNDAIPFDSLAVATGAGTGTGDGVICNAIPFVSLTVETEAGAEVGDGVMGDSIPFDSLSAGTEAGTGTERPAPQAPQSRSQSRRQALGPRNPRRRRPRSRSRSRSRHQAHPDPARAIRRFPCYNITSYKSSIRNLSLL